MLYIDVYVLFPPNNSCWVFVKLFMNMTPQEATPSVFLLISCFQLCIGNNMVAMQTCEMGATLVTLNIGC